MSENVASDPSYFSDIAVAREELIQSQGEYLKWEKLAGRDPAKQVVLVSVEMLADLPKAYPNYYADTDASINAVSRETSSV